MSHIFSSVWVLTRLSDIFIVFYDYLAVMHSFNRTSSLLIPTILRHLFTPILDFPLSSTMYLLPSMGFIFRGSPRLKSEALVVIEKGTSP